MGSRMGVSGVTGVVCNAVMGTTSTPWVTFSGIMVNHEYNSWFIDEIIFSLVPSSLVHIEHFYSLLRCSVPNMFHLSATMCKHEFQQTDDVWIHFTKWDHHGDTPHAGQILITERWVTTLIFIILCWRSSVTNIKISNRRTGRGGF